MANDQIIDSHDFPTSHTDPTQLLRPECSLFTLPSGSHFLAFGVSLLTFNISKKNLVIDYDEGKEGLKDVE